MDRKFGIFVAGSPVLIEQSQNLCAKYSLHDTLIGSLKPC